MSNYTPAPPDHYAVLEGVEHFRKSNPEGVPAYADVHTWSRSWSEDPGSDPRFLDADITTLANAVIVAIERGQHKALTKDLRNGKYRVPRPVSPAQPVAVVL